jgi:hypothetical protein
MAGRVGEQWAECSRCGFEYPLSKMTTQHGLIVCVANCLYEKGADYYRRLSRVPLERDPTEVADSNDDDDHVSPVTVTSPSPPGGLHGDE